MDATTATTTADASDMAVPSRSESSPTRATTQPPETQPQPQPPRGGRILVDQYQPAAARAPVTSLSRTALAIKNIAFSMSREEMLQWMQSKEGLPLPHALTFITDSQSGMFRGIAFANYSTAEEAARALELVAGMELRGRRLRAEYKAVRTHPNAKERSGNVNRVPKLHHADTAESVAGSKDADGQLGSTSLLRHKTSTYNNNNSNNDHELQNATEIKENPTGTAETLANTRRTRRTPAPRTQARTDAAATLVFRERGAFKKQPSTTLLDNTPALSDPAAAAVVAAAALPVPILRQPFGPDGKSAGFQYPRKCAERRKQGLDPTIRSFLLDQAVVHQD